MQQNLILVICKVIIVTINVQNDNKSYIDKDNKMNLIVDICSADVLSNISPTYSVHLWTKEMLCFKYFIFKNNKCSCLNVSAVL